MSEAITRRKLQMIIGEAVGPPFDRTVARLARMLPKLEGAAVPEYVLDFAESAVAHLTTAAEKIEETNKPGADRLRDQAEVIATLCSGKPAKAKKAAKTSEPSEGEGA